MKYNFCTLFDSNYLSRGLALYYSMEKAEPEFHLYIFAFDDVCYEVLCSLKLKYATIIPLQKFEDDELLRIKSTRNPAEYCWTCTSSTILYVINNFAVDACTYIDSDLVFYSSTAPIFEELGSKSILLTAHRYSPEYPSDEAKYGKYCVQFVTFKADENGLRALNWWREKCIEWCYNRCEDGKFGDQGYLNDWTERFAGVHEMQHPGGGLANWNISQYDIFLENGFLRGKDILTGNKFQVVFYHFHHLRLFLNDKIDLGPRKFSYAVLHLLYYPYIKTLLQIGEDLRTLRPNLNLQGRIRRRFEPRAKLLFIKRKLQKTYHIYRLSEFMNRYSKDQN